MKLKIRPGVLPELSEIQKLFSETITYVCKGHYEPNQIKAWKSSVENLERWKDLIQTQYFIVAELNNKIVGFASLHNTNHIDVLYVHKDFQRRRIAQTLFEELEREAKRLNGFILTSDVSKTAMLFFKSNGFEIVEEQIQVRKNVEIINYKMKSS